VRPRTGRWATSGYGHLDRLIAVILAYVAAVAVAIWVVLAHTVGSDRPIPTTAPPSGADFDLAGRVFAPVRTGPVYARATEDPTVAPLPLTRENIEYGADQYTRAGCVMCHGVSAEGVFGPRIAGTVLTPGAVRRQVRTPRSHYMPVFRSDQLSDQDIAAIYAFLQSLRRD